MKNDTTIDIPSSIHTTWPWYS